MTSVRICNNGRITFPASLRRKYGLREGNALQLFDVGDGSFFLTPVESKVTISADKAAEKIGNANVSLEDLLETLDQTRRDYFKENYVSH